jgi:peptidoglycan/LPS O-acetylase OafA/YrhL
MRSRPTLSFGRRLPGIEGLRAVAAMSVLVYHVYSYGAPDGRPPDLGPAGGLFPKLSLGVVLFFCLSGFLLYRPFAAAVLRQQPRPNVGRYFRNRALRIVPAYWCILLAVGIVFGAAVLTGNRVGFLTSHPRLLAADLLLVQNAAPATAHTGITPSWSLAVEVIFYLSLPLLGLLAGRLGRRATSVRGRRLAVLVPAAVLLAIGLSGRIAFQLLTGTTHVLGSHTWSYVLHQSFWFQGDLFAFGMVVAVCSIEVEDGRLRLPARWQAVVAGAVVVLVGVEFLVRRAEPTVGDTLWGAVFACVLALVVIRDGTGVPRLGRVLDVGPLVAVGLISYSVFLWNDPVVLWLSAHGLTLEGAGGFFVNVALVAAVTLGLSFVTYRLVELPAMRWRGRARRAPATIAAVDEGGAAAP